MKQYRVASPMPIAKVSAGALSGALVIVLAWLLKQYADVDLPDEVQSALVVLISAMVAYAVPIQDGEIEEVRE